MRKSVAELHDDYPYDKDERYWYYSVGFDEAAAMADELHVQDDPIAYLDSLRETDFERVHAINKSLLFLPPDVLVDQLGHEVAAWVVTNTLVRDDGDQIKEVLRQKAGYNTEDLEIAQNWLWQQGRQTSTKHTLRQYELMQSMKSGLLDTIDLPEILTASTRDAITLSQKRLGQYALIPIETEYYNNYYSGGQVKDWSGEVNNTLAYNMWLDTPSGFALTYKDVPNAMAGIAMHGMSELMVYQLQGVRPRRLDLSQPKYTKARLGDKVGSRGLVPLDWQKVLVTIIEKIGEKADVERAGIQAAKNNVWIKKRMPKDTKPHLPLETARRIYDDTAQQLGYAKRDDDPNGNWHKVIA